MYWVHPCLPQGEERAVERNEQRLADLKELSTTIAPLPLRRTHPTKPATVVALCDWTTGKVLVMARLNRVWMQRKTLSIL